MQTPVDIFVAKNTIKREVGMSGQLVEKSSSGGYTHDTHD
jgi:hypothetical protein